MRRLLLLPVLLACLAGPAAAAPWSLGGSAGGVFGANPHGLGGALTLDAGPELGRLTPTLGLELATSAGQGEVEVPGVDGTGTWRLRTSWAAPRLGAHLSLLPREEPTIPEVGAEAGLCFASTTSRTRAAGAEGPLAVDSALTPCARLDLGLFRKGPGSDLGARLGATLMPLESPLMTGSFRVFPTLSIVLRRRTG